MKFFRRILKDAFFALHRTELGSRASILSYHNIGDDDAFFTVSRTALDRQLQYIKAHHPCVLKLSELARRVRDEKDFSGCVALTFNDGYKSFYTDLFPLLKQYNLPATIFLAVELLDTTIQTSDGHTFQTLSMAEIREMQESGLVEFMPQAGHRIALNAIGFAEAAQQIEAAQKNVSSLTGADAAIFSFSKGTPTEQLAGYLREHKWLGAVVGHQEGLVHPHTDPFFLPRNAVNRETTFAQFKGKLTGAIEEYVEARSKY